MSELAELESSENLLAGKSAAEMKEAILGQQGETPSEPEPEQPQEAIPETPEPEPAPVAPEQPVEEPQRQADMSAIYQKGVQDALAQFKDILQKQQPAQQAKKHSPEELIEQFTKDPQNFLENLIEQKLTPHRSEIQKVEENTVRNTARRANSDFARLEPVVNKIMDIHPGLVQSKSAAERLEVYYLLAKGLEAQEQLRKQSGQNAKSDQKQAKRKQSASMLPEASKKSVPTDDDKPFDKLSAAEMKKRIQSMVR